MTSLALACRLNAAHLACGLNAAQSLPSKVARMVAALRRIGGSLWTVENAFSGAFVDNAGTQPVTAVGDLIGKVLDKTGTNHATQSAVACKPSVQRINGRNVISFDGSNDFLQTGIRTGNEGWVCAGVTFADADATFFSSGTTAANAGVWLYRNGRGAKSMNLAVANGSVIAYSPDIIPPTNTPIVVSGGWTATTVFAGVDHTETSTSYRSGASASVSPLRLGIATEDEIYPLNGLKHAAAYAPVLPDAATRKIIRNGIAALQGRTL